MLRTPSLYEEELFPHVKIQIFLTDHQICLILSSNTFLYPSGWPNSTVILNHNHYYDAPNVSLFKIIFHRLVEKYSVKVIEAAMMVPPNFHLR